MMNNNISPMMPMPSALVGTQMGYNQQTNPQIDTQQLALMQKEVVQNQSLLNKLFEDSKTNNKSMGSSIEQLKKHNTRIEQYKNESKKITDTDVDRDDIKNLVKDINRSLEDFDGSKSESDESETDDIENIEENKPVNSYIPEFVKEGLLIIIIYVLLSQEFVRNNIGKFITYINPDDTGKIYIIGYISYGTILAILFLFFKKVLF